MSLPPLVLASASPRRQAMLRAGGVAFSVRVSTVCEEDFLSGAPRAIALKLALAKADDVAQREPAHAPDTLILAADTIVVLENEIFNKPADRAEARAMLARLSGRTHTVITALTLLRTGGEALLDAVAVPVTFHPLAPEFIDAYVDSGEADDKAGAYGIQGLGSRLVADVEGDLTGVIGLPLGRLVELYRQATGEYLFAGEPPLSPREVAHRAFPELASLPPACLRGIPD